ncbi:MAG: hypothetical protein AVDCRST_MAG68-2100 [uncultured Gemmatimonadetes bacterium]|uniref:Uncharacterized protein n=1 Tax=uncultured Gemmatimonadota bacterium TaxID=203437 RepID=A0A6J4LA84_9BACT|nr:MAG: hypothetical protein AVDCRST_MAG68-2100 [uncultured Gemmatimonadota bacterium]
MPALVDDSSWVLERYREAKDIIDALGAGVSLADVREDIEDFCMQTAMDTCTTLDRDCGCNRLDPETVRVRALWKDYRDAVALADGPDPGQPSDDELRTIYAQHGEPA